MERTFLKKQFLAALLFVFSILILTSFPKGASGFTIYEEGDRFIEVNGLIQIQYHYTDPDGSNSTDEFFLRRLSPGIEAGIAKDWKGEIEFNIGEASGNNEVEVEEAVIEYSGFKDIEIALGNDYFVFSRELLTSYKEQELIERTFVGDHHYGTPEEVVGLFVKGELPEQKITFRASVAAADIEPDNDKLVFESPANKEDGFNQGWLFGARIDYHPFGILDFSQGDFDREMKATVSLAAFRWANDDDNNTNTTSGSDTSGGATPDVDTINGFEISGAFRYMGASVDVEYNLFNADLIDSSVTSGLFKNGSTDLENFAIEGGYMIIPSKLEIVAGYQWQDADNYATSWTRTSVGLNYFFKKHDLKAQMTYRIGSDLDGVNGNDQDEFFAQVQYVF